MKKIALGFALGIMASVGAAEAATGFQTDWLVNQLQFSMRVQPGEPIPADPRFPMMPRLRYLGTKILPNDVYAVYIRRVP